MRFFNRIFICACPHQPDCHAVTYQTKVFRKSLFVKGYSSILKYRSYKTFEQNFYLYERVCLVRIWTYKIADEKAHTFSRRSKNAKKRTNTDEKWILCKFTYTEYIHLVVKTLLKHYCTGSWKKCRSLNCFVNIMQDQNTALKQHLMLQARTAVRYGTPQFLLRSMVRWYGTFFFFFLMVRVRYVRT